MTNEKGAAGLGALAEATGVPIDLQALLRAEFEAWAKPTEEVALTRENVRRLLGLLKTNLAPVLEVHTLMDDGRALVTPHWASNLLETVIDGLADLDRGKTPPWLEQSPFGPGAAYTIEERKFNDALVELVAIVKQANLDPGYRGPLRLGEGKKAEAFVARKLDAAGATRRGGRAYTENSVRNLTGNNKRGTPLPD